VRSDALRERLRSAGLLVDWPEGVPEVLSDLTTDSRRVERGGVFVAYRGSEADGHDHVAAALEKGAGVIIAERSLNGVAVPVVRVSDGRQAAAIAASLANGDPANGLVLIAVTGTNGKTTTVHLLRHLFGEDAPAGSIGTLGAVDNEGDVLPGTEGLTTPGPVELMGTLAALRRTGARTVAMEASSHSLDQNRLWGLAFAAGIFTNLTRDHLDYHQTVEAYFAAKAKLLAQLAPDGWAVVNADDPAWKKLPPYPRVITFGIEHRADVRAEDIEGDALGMRFNIVCRGEKVAARIPLLGRFNVENALGVAAAAVALGRPLQKIAGRLAVTPQVPGRMERIAEQPCVVLRDYAHTPDALERAVQAVKPLTRGRLILVFGCGGDRDRGKRPVMGGVAARLADLAIVTSDNPRTEDPQRILDDIEEGMGATPHLRIVDRRQAIARALTIARPDDTILLAGKGHENYQVIGREKFPFDERVVVAEAIQAMARP